MYKVKRTGVFLDALNIAYASIENRKGCGMGTFVDYVSLMKSIKAHHDIVRALAYSGSSMIFKDLNVILSNSQWPC